MAARSSPFVVASSATSAVFQGENGHAYGFYSIATDNVGQREANRAKADTSTKVGVVIAPPVQG